MATATSNALIERQIAGFNNGSIDDVVAAYADDAVVVVVSPHTLPGSEWRVQGLEKITKHMQRVLDNGIADVELHWVGLGEGTLAWRDGGQFWGTTPFSEAHLATLNADGQIVEHWIHSVYAK
jgi:hypothetical protein